MQFNAYHKEPFQFRAQRQSVVVLHLLAPDHPDFLPLLQAKIEKTKKFFANAPIVVDVSELSGEQESVSLKDVVLLLKNAGLFPIAIQGGDSFAQDQGLLLGLPCLHERSLASLSKSEPVQEEEAEEKVATPERTPKQEPEVEAEPVVFEGALLVTDPVRSGQRIYAEGRDLICTSTVSAGAEILSDGNIHVYGSLRGRAFAGMKGNTEVGIFCTSLEAELVSVAGSYRVSDQFEKSIFKKHVQIYLQDNTLRVKLL